ncbi:MAG TPA: D-alanyl-lipoteichoic acid biosynthesis protein DltD [Drouetiella sp.]
MDKPDNRVKSLFIVAAVLFLAANSAASLLFSKYKQDQIREDFAAESIRHSSRRPDVVFAGSSTVLLPMYQLDFATYGRVPSIEQYTRIHFVEDALKQASGRNFQVNNISFLGFMISDDLFVIKQYLSGEHAPKTLVMMVAPRDFCDSLFESPAAGIAFRKMSDWSNTLDFCGTYLTQPTDYIDFLLGKTVFTYAMRAKIQEKLHDYVAQKQDESPVSQLSTVDMNLSAQGVKEKWAKSVREYTTRYRNISFEKMQKQFVFMNRLLTTCKERDIHVVLVNAPLTERNLEMLPEGLYEQYNTKLASEAKQFDCKFIDLSHAKNFGDQDFSDTVHLNELGAKKVLEAVIPDVNQCLNASSSANTAQTDDSKPIRSASLSLTH